MTGSGRSRWPAPRRECRDPMLRSPSPWLLSNTASSSSVPTARCCARPSSGMTPSQRRMRRRSCTELAPAAWARACGSVPVPSFTITKLRWLLRCEPDTLRSTASIMLPHDWLTFRLTGRPTTDRGDASGTGYWSPRESRYRYDLLDLVSPTFDWESALPDVLAPGDVAGEWVGAVGIVGPGTGDNMAAALGLGLKPGDLALSLGTSGDGLHRERGTFCGSHRNRRGVRGRDRPILAPGMHNERDQGDHCDRSHARRG